MSCLVTPQKSMLACHRNNQTIRRQRHNKTEKFKKTNIHISRKQLRKKKMTKSYIMDIITTNASETKTLGAGDQKSWITSTGSERTEDVLSIVIMLFAKLKFLKRLSSLHLSMQFLKHRTFSHLLDPSQLLLSSRRGGCIF
ncbi:hypothetical protein Tcan_00731, partial [Toxocara canis]